MSEQELDQIFETVSESKEVAPISAPPAADADVMAEIARLRAENARLQAHQAATAKTVTLTLKISEKGGLSVYGMGKFPLTLYKEQWRKLLAIKDQIEAFLDANDSKLSSK